MTLSDIDVTEALNVTEAATVTVVATEAANITEETATIKHETTAGFPIVPEFNVTFDPFENVTFPNGTFPPATEDSGKILIRG